MARSLSAGVASAKLWVVVDAAESFKLLLLVVLLLVVLLLVYSGNGMLSDICVGYVAGVSESTLKSVPLGNAVP